jgi:hypothetical protein
MADATDWLRSNRQEEPSGKPQGSSRETLILVKLPSEAVGSQRERQPRSGSPFCSFRAFQTELSQRAMMTASSSSATLIRFPVIFLLDTDIPGST